jgi:elongation factor Tu
MVDDKELLDLVELEVRELLSKYDFLGTRRRSSRKRAEGDGRGDGRAGRDSAIMKLIDALDTYIPVPERAVTAFPDAG